MMANETPLSDVRFLTVAEVATIMRVSKMTVYRLVHSGELEAIRVGRSFRVPEQAVNQYLRDAFVGTECPPAARGSRDPGVFLRADRGLLSTAMRCRPWRGGTLWR